MAILQDLMAACDECNIHEKVAMCIFRNDLTDPVRSFIRAHVFLPIESAEAQDGCLTLYSAIINYFINRYATDYNNATVDTDIRTFNQ